MGSGGSRSEREQRERSPQGRLGAEHRLARTVLAEARRTFLDECGSLTTEEALDAAGGYRSVLGIAKHVAGWSAVYLAYAFDDAPRGWQETDWPNGLRDRVEPTAGYLAAVLRWFEGSADAWLAALEDAPDLDEPRPVHWGTTLPLGEIVSTVASHWTYHAGEINEILAIRRGEAWEDGEEVEENHIDTTGHRVRPPWQEPPS